eukprot:m.1084884 g.1084884  ORF g.1084884 m.1084884 type:complete len:57 (-) comp24275_c0_seq11:518-688(-)
MPLFDLTTVVGRQACAAFFTLPPVTPSLCWPIAYGIEKQLVTMCVASRDVPVGPWR